MSIPAFVMKWISHLIMPIKPQVIEPIPILRLFTMLLDIHKWQESPASVIENRIKNQTHPAGMDLTTDSFQCVVGSQAPVHLKIVDGVVSMGTGFKQRSEQDGICTQRLDVVQIIEEH